MKKLKRIQIISFKKKNFKSMNLLVMRTPSMKEAMQIMGIHLAEILPEPEFRFFIFSVCFL